MAAHNPSVPEGEFSPHKPRSPPSHKHSHQPGREVSPPTFEAQTLSPGSAPADRTYAPQNALTTAGGDGGGGGGGGGHDGGGGGDDGGALDGVPGATSRDVYSGMGRPVQGMSSAQMHHDGQPGRKRQQLGLAKHGAGGDAQMVWERSDERFEKEEKGLKSPGDQPSKVLG